RAFVTLSQLNEVLVLDPTDPAAAGIVIPIQGEDPRALAASADGTKVFVAIFESGNHSTVVARSAVSTVSGPYAGQNPPPNAGSNCVPPIAADLPPPPPVAQIVKKASDGTWRDVNGADWSAFVTWDLHDHDVAVIDVSALTVTYVSGLLTNVTSISASSNGNV